MRKLPVFMLVFVISYLFVTSTTHAETTHYVMKEESFTQIISIENEVYHGDNIMEIGLFYEPGSKITWGDQELIISYRYLGIDNDNNLYILKSRWQRRGEEDEYSLIFKLNSYQTGVILLAGLSSQKNPVLIKLEVIATNLGIQVKYLGSLPEYKE